MPEQRNTREGASDVPYGICPACLKPFSSAPIHGGGYCAPDPAKGAWARLLGWFGSDREEPRCVICGAVLPRHLASCDDRPDFDVDRFQSAMPHRDNPTAPAYRGAGGGDAAMTDELRDRLADTETEKIERGTEIIRLRGGLEAIRDLPSQRDLALNPEARAMYEIALSTLEADRG